MIVKHQTTEEAIEKKMKVERFIAMIPPPPLIQLPWPGYNVDLTRVGKGGIKKEDSEKDIKYQPLYANCSSCLTIVHSSLLLTCRVGHLMCLPCWSNMVMTFSHFPLNRDNIFSMQVKHQGNHDQSCGCKISYYGFK